MTITPVVPRDLDQYIDTSQGLIIDYPAPPTSVRVQINDGADTLVWDDVSGFQALWSGNYITDAGVCRLVLDAPGGYVRGDRVYVITTTASESLDYKFVVGLERLTTEADVGRPQIIEAGAYVWSARVHTNESSWPSGFEGKGNIYLQVLDPRSGEVIIVPGNDVGLVYDVNRTKVIVYFVRHGVVYFMEADPGDTPDTKSQLRSIRETVNFGAPGAGNALDYSDLAFPPLKQAVLETTPLGPPGAGNYLDYVDAAFPPLKQAVVESLSFALAGSGNALVYNDSPYDAALTPNIADGMLSHSTIRIRVAKPTTAPESSLVVGYYLVRFDYGTPSVIGYQAFVGAAAYVEFEDLAPFAGVCYAALPLYYRSPYTLETVTSVLGAQVQLFPNSVSQYVDLPSPGAGNALTWIDSSFPPIGP
jgi:hypothetical protein